MAVLVKLSKNLLKRLACTSFEVLFLLREVILGDSCYHGTHLIKDHKVRWEHSHHCHDSSNRHPSVGTSGDACATAAIGSKILTSPENFQAPWGNLAQDFSLILQALQIA